MDDLVREQVPVRVPLTRGLYALIDAADIDLVAPYPWHAKPWSNGSGKFYAARNVVGPDGKKTTVTLHRHLMNPGPGEVVDHRNGDGLDCRRKNLRCCSTAKNNANRRTKTPGWRGVKKIGGQWFAIIRDGDTKLRLGPFDHSASAAWAYNREAKRLHGEFAVMNPIGPYKWA